MQFFGLTFILYSIKWSVGKGLTSLNRDRSKQVSNVLQMDTALVPAQAIEERFFEVLFVILYKSTSRFSAIQMKATEQYFPAVLFIMLYKVALTFASL